MSIAITFDTLAYVKELETAGIPPAHAEAQAKALAVVIQKVEENRKEELATKRDIDDLRRDIDAKLEKMELRMVIKMGAMILASIGLIVGTLRAFPVPVQFIPQTVQEMHVPAPTPPTTPSTH
ncbi:MAG: DUF1640 domain-containing protein [Magnetococcales bacterium]|nr:DUF1640 domain-containing protein [Magnetococcales bacterium]